MPIWKAKSYKVMTWRIKNKFFLLPEEVDGYWHWLTFKKVLQHFQDGGVFGGEWRTYNIATNEELYYWEIGMLEEYKEHLFE